MEDFPAYLMKSVLATIEHAMTFVREKNPESRLHCRLREASETVSEMIKVGESYESPNWYLLYEGMIGLYVQLKVDYREMRKENKKLRAELSEFAKANGYTKE